MEVTEMALQEMIAMSGEIGNQPADSPGKAPLRPDLGEDLSADFSTQVLF